MQPVSVMLNSFTGLTVLLVRLRHTHLQLEALLLLQAMIHEKAAGQKEENGISVTLLGPSGPVGVLQELMISWDFHSQHSLESLSVEKKKKEVLCKETPCWWEEREERQQEVSNTHSLQLRWAEKHQSMPKIEVRDHIGFQSFSQEQQFWPKLDRWKHVGTCGQSDIREKYSDGKLWLCTRSSHEIAEYILIKISFHYIPYISFNPLVWIM